MAKGIYWGGGTSRKVKKVYLGINGSSRKVKKGYIGDETGKARLFYSSGRIWKKYNAIYHPAVTTYYWNKYNAGNATLGYHQNYGADTNADTWYLTGNGSAWDGGLYNYTFSPDGKVFSNGRDQLASPGSSIRDMAQGSACGYYKSHEYRQIYYANACVITMASPYETDKFFEADIHTNGSRNHMELHVYTIVPGRKTTLVGEVSSTNSAQYPNNGVVGVYYYEYTRQNTTNAYYTQGSYISDIEADPGTYPANGRHSDGYWYVLQPE